MKKLLIVLLFALGSAAYANDKDGIGIVPPPGTEEQETISAKKVSAKPKAEEVIAKPVTNKEQREKTHSKKTGTEKQCSSRFGITEYFVDIVHHSNVKLVKLLL